jgi:hypothetical protein
LCRFVSVDSLQFKYPNYTPYAYCGNNPINKIDPDGLTDIYIFKDENGETATKTVDTGDKEPNRLFVQDANATAETKNRKAFEGMYFEQQMIPMDAYFSEDFENNHPLSFLGMGSSQFEKDREEYVGRAGKYSDKNLFERTAESIKEEGLGNKAVELVSIVLSKGKAGKVMNGMKNAFSHTKKSQSTGKLKGAKGDSHDAQYTHGGKHRPENPNKRKGADDRRYKGKRVN